jgi:glucose-1-phosphate cytidylyltransferase
MRDATFQLRNNSTKVHQENTEPWEVILVNTGETTRAGGRCKRLQS